MNAETDQPGEGFDFRVEEGGLIARIVIPTTVDPTTLQLEDVEALAKERGIVLDDDHRARLSLIVERFVSAPSHVDEVIVEGTGPTNGEDGRCEWIGRFDPASQMRIAAEDGNDRVDYRAVNSYVRVSAGDHVATVYPPGAHEDGCDVRGGAIRAKPGVPCSMQFDQTFDMEPEGNVVAVRSGVMRYERDSTSINALFDVPGGVDYSIGNIDFEGCVNIREGILDRFQVHASGDIHVGGLVESANIDCGGGLICRQGIVGKGRGTVNVGGDFQAVYINDLTGDVKGNLIVAREILNSQITVGCNVQCSRGAIIGGHLTFAGALSAAMIGSRAHVPTVIEFADPRVQSGQSERPSLEVRDRIHSHVSFRHGDEDLMVTSSIAGPVTIELARSGELMLHLVGHRPTPLRERCRVRKHAA